MDKLRMKSLDASEGNVAKIAALFPQCVTERLNKDGKPELAIDFDKLRDELSKDLLDGAEERYQFTWPDKRAASRLANEPTDKTLRPDIEASVDFWNTENLYIEGDNLDVLKVLRENYLGKVKMIYIDPPYNTGNDFVYNDDFAQGRDEFEQNSGLFDEEGNQLLDPMQRNTESNGRFHTDWLNMIYPRLKVARDLLTNDGIIYISINDCEINNLSKVCDEVFGAINNIVNAIWVNGRTSAAHFTHAHEYILAYAKDIYSLPLFKYKGKDEIISDRTIKKPGTKNPLSIIEFPAGIDFECDDKVFPCKFGSSEPVEIVEGALECRNRKSLYPVSIKAAWAMADMIKDWLKGKDVIDQKGQKVLRFFFKENGVLQYEKAKATIHPNSVITELSTKKGSSEVDSLVGAGCFSFPKPSDLIKSLILNAESNDIILDFFSGSATTAHAVMKLNAEDGGHRKFIMVQLPEVTDEKSEARKAGYETICQIGEERIRRAGKIVKEEAGLQGQDLDVGFRVLKLDSSNMEDVFYTPEDFDAKNIFTTVDNVKPDRTPLDLLFQVLPELNIELSAKIETQEVNGKKVFFVDGNYLIATFDTEVNESTVTEIAKMKPQYFVMRDASAANDNVLDNFEQIFRHYSPDTIRKIL